MTKERKTDRARAAGVARRSRATASAPPASANGDVREQSIALAAYYRAERRGFAPGAELADWLEAEAEFDMTADRMPATEGERTPESMPDEFN